MADTQVAFEELLPEDEKKKSTSKKRKSTSSKNSSKESLEKKKSQKSATGSKNKKTTSKTASKATTKKNSKTSAKKSSVKAPKKSTTKSSNPKSKKTSSTKRTVKGRNSKVNITQEDMDKLCEVYDWYLQVKDLDIIEANTQFKQSSIEVEDNIIKSKKRISSVVDESTWDDFSRLCENTSHKKSDLLTQAMKEFLLKHKDLV